MGEISPLVRNQVLGRYIYFKAGSCYQEQALENKGYSQLPPSQTY